MRLRNIPGAKDAILDCEWVIDEPERFKGKWNEVFGVKRPLFLEVGMGKGRFLMDMARLHPERNFVGIERGTGRCGRGVFQSCFYPGGCKIAAGDF